MEMKWTSEMVQELNEIMYTEYSAPLESIQSACGKLEPSTEQSIFFLGGV